MSCLERNVGVLSINDRLVGFFEKYRDILVVQSKSKKGRSLLVRKGLDIVSTGYGKTRPSKSVKSRKKKIGVSTDKCFYRRPSLNSKTAVKRKACRSEEYRNTLR